MPNQPVQTVLNTLIDKIKLVIAAVIVVMTISSFILLSEQSFFLRISILLIGFVIAICVVLKSVPGRNFLSFIKESIREIQQVIWPTRKEAVQVTTIVFVFVLIMAVFLWGIDKLFEFLLYDVILAWT